MAKKRSRARASRPRAKERPFQQTDGLYHALIRVEVEARMYCEQLQRAHQALERHPPPADFRYVAPPNESDAADVREFVEQQRAEILADRTVKLVPKKRAKARNGWPIPIPSTAVIPAPFKYWYEVLDFYHKMEQRLRRAIDNGRNAALAAVPELDKATTPPLDRATTKIRESLQDLGGCVPVPGIVGFMPPGIEVADLVRQSVSHVSGWVNRLRALVHPRAPDLALSQRGAGTEEPPDPLPNRHLAILRAMVELGGLDRAHLCSADDIAERAFGDSDSNNAKAPLADMRKWGLTQSKRGPGGGCWLTPMGLEYARKESFAGPQASN